MAEPYSYIAASLPRTILEKNSLVGYRDAEYEIVDTFP